MPSRIDCKKPFYLNSRIEVIYLYEMPNCCWMPSDTYIRATNDDGKGEYARYWYGSGHDVFISHKMLEQMDDLDII